MNGDSKTMKEIAKFLEKYEVNLSRKENEYLLIFSCNTSNYITKNFTKKLIQKCNQQKTIILYGLFSCGVRDIQNIKSEVKGLKCR